MSKMIPEVGSMYNDLVEPKWIRFNAWKFRLIIELLKWYLSNILADKRVKSEQQKYGELKIEYTLSYFLM